MRQNPVLLAARRFEKADESMAAAIARATASLAQAAIAKAPAGVGLRITLSGNLGAGKTTWVRAFLRACGIAGRIKSPSFSVAETYEHEGRVFHHLDFYRQSDPLQWQGGGLRDLLAQQAIVLIEWPEHAQGLPKPHIEVSIGWQQDAEASAPRNIALHFFDQQDGIAIGPYLSKWQEQVAESGHGA